jgi:hypothetical protein
VRRPLPLVAAVLLLAGCGSAQSTRTVTETARAPVSVRPPSKAQFVAHADLICKRAGRAIDPLSKILDQTQGASSPAAWRASASAVLRAQAITAASVAQVRALPEPAEDRAVIAKWLGAFDSEAVLLGPVASAFQSRDNGALNFAEQNLSQVGALARGLAQGYGFKVCGQAG